MGPDPLRRAIRELLIHTSHRTIGTNISDIPGNESALHRERDHQGYFGSTAWRAGHRGWDWKRRCSSFPNLIKRCALRLHKTSELLFWCGESDARGTLVRAEGGGACYRFRHRRSTASFLGAEHADSRQKTEMSIMLDALVTETNPWIFLFSSTLLSVTASYATPAAKLDFVVWSRYVTADSFNDPATAPNAVATSDIGRSPRFNSGELRSRPRRGNIPYLGFHLQDQPD